MSRMKLSTKLGKETQTHFCRSVIHGSVMQEYDYVMLWNLSPQDYNEAVALIPTLSYYPDTVVKEAIDFLKS